MVIGVVIDIAINDQDVTRFSNIVIQNYLLQHSKLDSGMDNDKD